MPSVRPPFFAVPKLPMRNDLTIIILAHNEAADLPDCLASVEGMGRICLVDSGSTDDTISIASKVGCEIYINPFESFGVQRNWALDHCQITTPWILFLDADERADEAFRQAVFQAITDSPDRVAGYFCCWKTMLDGTWLRRCDSFPKWQFRLHRKDRARFRDSGHGQKEDQVQGEIHYLHSPYEHYSFSKGWRHWITKHNTYSTQEAIRRAAVVPDWRGIFSKNESKRNEAIKSVVSHLPGWPLIRFSQMYFLKLGFLEGRAGLVYCINMAYYEFLIQIKMHELQACKRRQ